MNTAVRYLNALPTTVALLSVSLAIGACSSSKNTNGEPPNDDASRPTVPTELKGTVYSSTEVELFWSPSSDDGWVMGYDIYRNDELIVERLDANSYLDPELEPGSSYSYAVIAVDDDDNMSAAATLNLTTHIGPPLPTINRANHVSLLAQLFEVTVGDNYNKPLLSLEKLALDQNNGEAALDEDTHMWNKYYSCSNDGSGSSERRDGYPGESRLSMQFTACDLQGKVFNGAMTGSGYRIQSEGFSITTSNTDTVRFSGTGTRKMGSREPYGAIPSWILTDANLTQNTADGSLVLTDANTNFSAGITESSTTEFTAFMEADLKLKSLITGNQTITVSTPVRFHYQQLGVPYTSTVHDIDWQFEEGTLELSAQDGSKLTLNAANGDDNTATITLSGAGQSAEFTKPWSLWKSIFVFEGTPESPAFSTDAVTDTPVIRSDNYQTLLDDAFDVMTGTRHWDDMVSVPVRWSGNQSFDPDLELGWAYSVNVCNNDGTAKTQHTLNGWYFEYAWAEFSNCLFNTDSGIIYTGDVRGFTNVGGHGLDSNGLSLQRQPDLELSYTGWIRRSSSFTKNDSYNLRHTHSWSADIKNPDGTETRIQDAAIYFGAGWLFAQYRADLAGRAVIQTSDTNNHLLEITTPIAFNRDIQSTELSENARFQQGQLRLLADDGSELLLDADNGDESTVKIRVTNSGGTADFSAPWSNWQSYIARVQ